VIGVRLDNRYELVELIGRGAYGAVYRAHDDTLDRDVAVKILTAPALDAEARDRMLREARAAAALNHPGVVAIYDTGEDQGRPFLVMELIDGKNLRETASLALPELRDVAIQICDALAHAHANGIVHRDLKPENVLIAEGPTVKLADLGIAYSARGTRLTSDGTILGTAAYLAPEQAMGLDVDGRADLYALGVMLYERLAGRLPFEGDDPLTVISQHLHAPVVPPRTYRPDLPPGLEAIILRLLAKSPADRFANAGETAAALADATLDPASEGADSSATADRLLVLDQLARGRLIGRRGEIQQLRELWQRARRGQGHLALISGEPGVGKTRLAHEAIVYAQLNGATVLRGGSYEYEATTPYLPFVEAMRGWVRDQPIATLRERVGDGAAELARFAPQIEATLGPLPVNPVLPPHEDRLRLFDHVARFFRSLAADGGLLLFLDDLHWADHGTLALLHYLMRDLREAPWLAVATYREVELGRDHPLASSLVEWNRERLATRVSLGRFGLPETSAMLATLFGQETVSPDFAAVIHRETEGNPFFIEEVVKALIEQGQIYREGGAWQRQRVDDLLIPQSIKSAIGHRLERLTPACLDVLHAAAALGKTLAFSELAASVGGSEDALLDALDEACAAQLMRADPGERFAFTHDKIREVLYEEQNPIRRRRQHQKIGEALERLYKDEIEEHAPDLAFHFTEGGHLEKGLDYSLRAARRAMKMVATDEALGHLRRARDSAEALEDRERLMEIDESIGDLYGMRGEFGLGIQAYERVLAAKPDPARRAIILGQIGELYTQWSDPRAMEYLNAALEALDPATQPAPRAKALAMIGRHYHYRAEHRKSIEYYEQARALAEPIDDPMALCFIYAYLAGAYQHMAKFPQSMEWAQRCIALGERHQNALITSFGNEFMAEDLGIISRLDESMGYVKKNIELARRIGSLDRMAWTALPAAFAHYMRGDLDKALAESDRGIELMERISDVRGSVFPHRMRATVLLDMARNDEAKAEAELTYELGKRVAQHMLVSEGRSALGYWKLYGGDDPAGAAALGRETEDACARSDNRNALINMYPWYPEALIAAGMPDEAERAAASAIALSEECADRVRASIARRHAAAAAAAKGDAARAKELIERAVKDLESTDAKLELARALATRSELRRAAGDEAGAGKDRAKAKDLFERCGAVRELTELRSTAERT
jgi:tRNA A-37 threonylcarbamoyl transferase component Bud32/tetratricopeptide (TPR) repeat protein